MFNAAVMVSSGMWVQRKLGEINLPQLSRPIDEVGSFKLSVQVHAASVQGLSDPSLLKRERPRVEVVVGQSRKETELGDFRPDAAAAGRAASFKKVEPPERSEPEPETEGQDKDQEKPKEREKARDKEKNGADSAEGPTCSWTFGDTLTFTATRADILAGGVQVWLRTQSEVRIGSLLQVNMAQSCEVGMCSVDIRKRVLPACAPRGFPDSTGGSSEGAAAGAPMVWETPPMLLPVTHVGGGRAPPGDKPFVLGENSGHVSVSFSVNMDPQLLLKSADEATMPLVQRVTQPLKDWTVRTAGSAATATQDWALKTAGAAYPAAVYAAGATADAVRVAAVSTHNALEEPVRWVLENADIETCTTKTRDRATRFLDDHQCGTGLALQDVTPTQVMPQPTTRAFMSPKSPAKSPTAKSQATTLTPSPQHGFGSTLSSGFVSNLGSGISTGFASAAAPGASPLRQPVAIVRAGSGGLAPQAVATVGSSIPHALASSVAAPSTSSRAPPPGRVPAAGARSAAVPAGPSAAAAGTGGSGVSGQLPAPPPAAALKAAQQARMAPAQYYVPAGQAGLPTRQSFQVPVAGHNLPTRQSFQVVQMVPAGYPQRGVPTRQSFQVVSAPMQAPPQYVRPGTVS